MYCPQTILKGDITFVTWQLLSNYGIIIYNIYILYIGYFSLSISSHHMSVQYFPILNAALQRSNALTCNFRTTEFLEVWQKLPLNVHYSKNNQCTLNNLLHLSYNMKMTVYSHDGIFIHHRLMKLLACS